MTNDPSGTLREPLRGTPVAHGGLGAPTKWGTRGPLWGLGAWGRTPKTALVHQ
jgi:hypothetical protein